MDALAQYAWPGNIREMQNVIERAVILSPDSSLHIVLGDLPAGAPQAEVPAEVAPVTLADAEREHILGALRESDWVLGGPKRAAARLGMARSTLHWRMKKLGLSRPRYARLLAHVPADWHSAVGASPPFSTRSEPVRPASLS